MFMTPREFFILIYFPTVMSWKILLLIIYYILLIILYWFNIDFFIKVCYNNDAKLNNHLIFHVMMQCHF
jgi:hypothetical protein